MTFDEYYEATDKKLMELSYTEPDDFKRRHWIDQRSFLDRIKVGNDKIYDEARERIMHGLESYHGEDANIRVLEDVDQWMCGLAMKKIYGNKGE